MKIVADSRGRLAARKYFRPGAAFDVSRQPDGSIRLVELVEKEVPLVKVKLDKDGSFECPRRHTRRSGRAMKAYGDSPLAEHYCVEDQPQQRGWQRARGAIRRG